METPNTGVFQVSLQQQLNSVNFVFKSLDEKVNNVINTNIDDLNNIPHVLQFVEQLLQHFFIIMKEAESSPMDKVGLDELKEAYCDFKASLQLIDYSIKNVKSNQNYLNDLKVCDNILFENSWYFKKVKDRISEATRLSFQSNVTSRFNSLLNGGNSLVQKSKLIENVSKASISPPPQSVQSLSPYAIPLSIMPTKDGVAHPLNNDILVPNRPRSIYPSPAADDNDSRLLDLYSLKKYIDIETLMDIYNKFDNKILLIDFRPSMIFKQNHISLFSNILNIEPLSVKPHYTMQDILDHSLLLASTKEQLSFKNISTYDLIIVLDQSSIHEKLSIDLIRLLSIIDEKNNDIKFKLKRKPVLLDGGFEEWYFFMNNQSIDRSPRLSKISPLLVDNYTSNISNNYVHSPPLISRSPSPTAFFPASSMNTLTNSFYTNSKINSISTLPSFSSLKKGEPVKNPNILVPIPATSTIVPPIINTIPPSSYPKIINTPTPNTLAPPSIDNTSNINKLPASLMNTPIRSSTPTASPILVSGLKNLGNTCYMNSSLQCMIGTKELTNYLLQGLYHQFVAKDSKLGSRGKLTNEYQKLAKLMLSNTIKKVSTNPKDFKAIVGKVNSAFNNCDQQDSAEFLHFILDTIHEDLNWCANKESLPALSDADEANRELLPIRLASTIEWEKYLKTDYSSIIEIFSGQYASGLECGNCHKTSTTYIPFNMLSVPIPMNNLKQLSVYDCVDEFVSPELLKGDNAWKCPRCKMDKLTKKQLTITRLPRVLIIHLERFSITKDYRFVKNSTKVDIPLKLDMKKYWPKIRDEQEKAELKKFPLRGQTGEWEYQLYGIVRHYGTLNGGHYTSEVKKNGKWVKFDDDNVTPGGIGKRPENNGSAYILFYEKIC